ncbi:hypothetical protein APX70_03577 [Pseudomonas syringae pv. maculicola]|uniref:Uncharacterized protein n=1 Tax=Pseudomonas syringae pv. maculicola TaxID=59511 RepID=A0A3M2VWV9_PSEYM|nr:hypothetical protein APX70_03577 [Pseudomonas syringae pv. maculicola]
MRVDAQYIADGALVFAEHLGDHRGPGDPQTHRAAFARGLVDAQGRAGVALFFVEAQCTHRITVQRQQQRIAAGFAIQIAGVKVQRRISQRHIGRHRQVELAARICSIEDDRAINAQLPQLDHAFLTAVSRDPVDRLGQRALGSEGKGRHQSQQAHPAGKDIQRAHVYGNGRFHQADLGEGSRPLGLDAECRCVTTFYGHSVGTECPCRLRTASCGIVQVLVCATCAFFR